MQKLQRITTIFAAVLLLDLTKFFLFTGPTLINWRSWPHVVWVLFALALLLLSQYLQSERLSVCSMALYSGVAILAAANHYYPFSAILTYNCFLFNLLLVAIYYLRDYRKKTF